MNSQRATVNLVIIFLGLTILFGMGIGGYLAVFDKNVPDFIVATTAGGIGALGAMLAKTSTTEDIQKVTVAEQPVKTEEVAPTPTPRKRSS